MKQSRRMSLIEAGVNVAVGYGVAVAAQIIVFPWFGLSASLGDSLAIAAIFTVVSILRSYVMRRVFEAIRVRGDRARTLPDIGSRHSVSEDWPPPPFKGGSR